MIKFLIFCNVLFTSTPLYQGYKSEKSIGALINDGLNNSDSVAITKSIKGFLLWYKSNYNKANSVGFTKSDKKGNYVVDMVACNKYLAILKSSTFISERYLTEWRKYFESKSQAFIDNPQNEGPPEGFDFDLVLLNQEPDLILNNVKNLKFKVKEMHKTTAIVEVMGEFTYNFEMRKINGKWMIDYIGSENYD
ncbi:MAG: hypothetical protein IPL55_13285 [Saprospiraceae bacterium]|jgi:hypothetical protein|nr:hypothetical protein [Saprospiraceae bacterium]